MKILQRAKNLWMLSGLQVNFEQFSEKTKRNEISIKSFEGGELIMPNFIRERFDNGKVTSLADII